MSLITRMPAIFYGHGSPMNALDDNAYTRVWQSFAKRFARPKAILAVSAHWTTQGTEVTAMPWPKTIHDFGGFPKALFDVNYAAAGDSSLAARVAEILAPLPVKMNHDWGLDHGTWSVLIKTYPKADIPVIQLSLDMTQDAATHFSIGQKLARLRDEGVMIIGSGNIVHNLARMDQRSSGYDWALRFNAAMRSAILAGQFERVLNYHSLGTDAALSVPTSEHFLPLLYVLGTRLANEPIEIVAEGMELGAISMMSVIIGE